MPIGVEGVNLIAEFVFNYLHIKLCTSVGHSKLTSCPSVWCLLASLATASITFVRISGMRSLIVTYAKELKGIKSSFHEMKFHEIES